MTAWAFEWAWETLICYKAKIKLQVFTCRGAAADASLSQHSTSHTSGFNYSKWITTSCWDRVLAMEMNEVGEIKSHVLSLPSS